MTADARGSARLVVPNDLRDGLYIVRCEAGTKRLVVN
ncbi:hypothetical protein [Hymenobacter sp. DG25B]